MDTSETGVTWAIAAQRKYTKRQRVRRQEQLRAIEPRTCRKTRSLGWSWVRLSKYRLRGDVDEINRGPKGEKAQIRTDQSGTSPNCFCSYPQVMSCSELKRHQRRIGELKDHVDRRVTADKHDKERVDDWAQRSSNEAGGR